MLEEYVGNTKRDHLMGNSFVDPHDLHGIMHDQQLPDCKDS